MDLQKYLDRRKKYIDTALDKLLVKETEYPANLYKAVRYSMFAGGKRIRPILVLAACDALGGNKDTALYPACAVEMIHTYSLIHDDLPAMDDDTFRRGKLTCHKAFNEATAILAGDALLTEAFSVLANKKFVRKVGAQTALEITKELAIASGYKGMVAGQMIDMELQGTEVDFAKLEFMHIHKTGALIRASLKIGALASESAPDEMINKLVRYGEYIGLAFQVADDILDVEGNMSITGKSVGMDKKLGKVTYPKLVGLKEARRISEGLIQSALKSIRTLDGRADPLREIASFIIDRKK